jgi:tetratricopeptide repeat protein 30
LISSSDDAAKESLADMPPRSEGELDAVTLHNVALMHMDDNPNEHLPKLNFLLTAPASPSTTFANLLLLYCKYGYYHVAADLLAENVQLTYTHLGTVSSTENPSSPNRDFE